MKYKLIFALAFFLVALPLVSAETNLNDLGSYPQGKCVLIKQVCATCSYVNVSISYPNSSLATQNGGMNKIGSATWTFEFCNTTTKGRYDINGEGDISGSPTAFTSYWFDITSTGNRLGTENSILYLGLIAILIFLFLLIVFNVNKLPSKDNMSDDGFILSINHLKYLRPVFYAIAWGLLLAITFVTSNISLAYLPMEMFGEFFFMVWRVMFILTFPMILIWFLYMFVGIFKDKEVKHMLERGIELRGKP